MIGAPAQEAGAGGTALPLHVQPGGWPDSRSGQQTGHLRRVSPVQPGTSGGTGSEQIRFRFDRRALGRIVLRRGGLLFHSGSRAGASSAASSAAVRSRRGAGGSGIAGVHEQRRQHVDKRGRPCPAPAANSERQACRPRGPAGGNPRATISAASAPASKPAPASVHQHHRQDEKRSAVRRQAAEPDPRKILLGPSALGSASLSPIRRNRPSACTSRNRRSSAMPAISSAGPSPPRPRRQSAKQRAAAVAASPAGQGTMPNATANSPPAVIKPKRSAIRATWPSAPAGTLRALNSRRSRRTASAAPAESATTWRRKADPLGMFVRAGWTQGTVEQADLTGIDESVSIGLSLTGRRWGRPDNTVGLAGVASQISRRAKEYFAAGGIGGIIGDVQLPEAGPAQILETFYKYTLPSLAKVALDTSFSSTTRPTTASAVARPCSRSACMPTLNVQGGETAPFKGTRPERGPPGSICRPPANQLGWGTAHAASCSKCTRRNFSRRFVRVRASAAAAMR